MTSAPKPKRVFDVDLFESAAKAAGITLEWWDDDGSLNPGYIVNRENDLVSWDPLSDDGDALRLAVKLQLTVCNEHLSAGVAYCTRQKPGNGIDEDTYPEVRSGMNESELIAEDYAATRRAIVRAAAEIGRRMKS